MKSRVQALHTLAQNTRSSSISSPSKNNGRRVHKKLVKRQTPVLTMTMITLYDVFESFCRHLTDATYINVQTACLVLESGSIETASTTSVPSSPATIIDSPSSHTSSSPSRSPITSWLIGSYTLDQSTSQKSEWEKVCQPLVMFAGLEAIYSACLHLESYDQASALERLYRRTSDDLRLIREVLCDPFVHSTEYRSSVGQDLISSYRAKSETLTTSLEAIMSLCECRCKLIAQQTKLYLYDIVDGEKIMASFQMILSNIPKREAKSTCLVQSTAREVEGWCNIMNTYNSIRKLRFMNTIVGCQKIKMKLNVPSNTRIQKWMLKVYQSFLSILPLYFESFSSHAVSRYGFQESLSRGKNWDERSGRNSEVEAKLDEFLRSEVRNGNHLAIALVADVSAFHMLRSKASRGSFLGKQKTLKTSQGILESDDIYSAYPALYIRTTVEHNISGQILGNRMISGKKEKDTDSNAKKNDTNFTDSRTDMNSWPYMSWLEIVPMLKNTLLSSSEEKISKINWTGVNPNTSVFVSSVYNGIWLVAIKKKTHNRRQTNEEDTSKELQFLQSVIDALQLKDTFKPNIEPSTDGEPFLLSDLRNILVGDRFPDAFQLSKSFKQIFGLRSFSDGSEVEFHSRIGIPSHSFLQGPQHSPSTSAGHFAFFLGTNLILTFSGAYS